MLTINSKAGRASLKKHILLKKLIPYCCQKCNNDGHWNGESINLELDHINGIRTDNRLENLRFLCPNCHSQQPTSNRTKTLKKIKESEIIPLFKKCSNIREILLTLNLSDASSNYKRIKKIAEKYNLHFEEREFKIERDIKWGKMSRPSTRKVERPSKEILEKLVWEKPTETIGKEFGVSGKAVEKWCKIYKISKPQRGYWTKRRCNGPDYESESA